MAFCNSVKFGRVLRSVIGPFLAEDAMAYRLSAVFI